MDSAGAGTIAVGRGHNHWWFATSFSLSLTAGACGRVIVPGSWGWRQLLSPSDDAGVVVYTYLMALMTPWLLLVYHVVVVVADSWCLCWCWCWRQLSSLRAASGEWVMVVCTYLMASMTLRAMGRSWYYRMQKRAVRLNSLRSGSKGAKNFAK